MERLAQRLDRVAERLEQPADDGLAISCRQDRNPCLEWQRLIGELLALLAAPAHRRAEVLGDRAREERRGDVGAVVDVWLEGRAGPTTADQPDRIDVEHESGRAARIGRLGVEDVRRAERQRARVDSTRALVEEVAEVGRGRPGERDRQQHPLAPGAARIPLAR